MQGKILAGLKTLKLKFSLLQESGCLYNFKSVADIERHMIIVHDKKGSDVNPFGFTCKFKDPVNGNVCGLVFTTRHYQRKHKQEKH